MIGSYGRMDGSIKEMLLLTSNGKKIELGVLRRMAMVGG
tara:strand:+ start:1030 stop:1146 length:117 start_codon:yes stop_codon:yes gene_type:complete